MKLKIFLGLFLLGSSARAMDGFDEEVFSQHSGHTQQDGPPDTRYSSDEESDIAILAPETQKSLEEAELYNNSNLTSISKQKLP